MYYTGIALFKKVNDFPVSSRDVTKLSSHWLGIIKLFPT
jgi:hypothetical protein